MSYRTSALSKLPTVVIYPRQSLSRRQRHITTELQARHGKDKSAWIINGIIVMSQTPLLGVSIACN